MTRLLSKRNLAEVILLSGIIILSTSSAQAERSLMNRSRIGSNIHSSRIRARFLNQDQNESKSANSWNDVVSNTSSPEEISKAVKKKSEIYTRHIKGG